MYLRGFLAVFLLSHTRQSLILLSHTLFEEHLFFGHLCVVACDWLTREVWRLGRYREMGAAYPFLVMIESTSMNCTLHLVPL